MTPPVFLVDPAVLAGDRIRLDGPEGRHAVAVRRIREGETVDLSDGLGLRVRCEVAEVVGKDTLVCRVLERLAEPEPTPRITVVQALPKRDRGELAVEMMTEAGVDAVVPWAAERCVTQWKGDRGAKALAKWRASAREAAKQARRARTPEVAEPLDRKGVSALLAEADLAVVLHEEGAQRLSELPLPKDGQGEGTGAGIVLVVGPEGGISDAELTAFDEAGAVRSLLGPSVLRTSTAGVAALAVLQARTGRW
ncbi:MAG: 16S rRNA (uracil(1498)-N(3))-methyltransferase [Nocardiopsis sp. BM-2018]|uniref:Ribosomal RNA small subunit methyltransferase E n=1 Tax=Nocardiopsis metallicus TaxID=179819 RepID=A0A840VXI2_9ACTN|nr:16S rRNA (uracil(1498)-N(3))-methyltransferase [Nocardiopsis metallicus]MBB5489069.1 16S rRNA (uracil1498-N3)-methyltransferase [Nocardiopsis metallicus]QRN79301.1 MAG: 16S rRNA (uracil(1498)-N(3))-methyltransferase [Nocardiopsis sp. BM-2018]